MQSLNKQRGAAIIVALFVVALVAAAATMMIARLRIDIRRTELILNATQATLYAQSSVAWAIDQLNTNWKQQQPNKVIDKTPIQLPVTTLNGYEIASTIYDAQSYFNINNLSSPQYQTNFTRLIQVVAPTTDAQVAQDITQSVIAWISPGSQNPTLDDFYLKQSPSYRAAHTPMLSPSELRLVKGITPELFAKLSPYIIALPEVTQINVNNADIPVLMSLSMTLTPDSAKSIMATCKQNPFTTVQNFLNYDVVKNNPFDANKITVTSSYFLIETNVTLRQQKITLYTLVQRATKDKDAITTILWQSKGTL